MREPRGTLRWIALGAVAILVAGLVLLLLDLTMPGLMRPGPEDGEATEEAALRLDADASAEPTLIGRGPTQGDAGDSTAAPLVPSVPNARVLTGRVVDDATGRVLAAVDVVFAFQFARRDEEPVVRTADDGSFVFGAFVLGVGDCCLVDHVDYAPYVRRLPYEIHGVPVGGTFDLGELRLVRGASLSGEVRRPDGSPADAAAVCVCDHFGFVGGFRPANASAETTTDEGGRFRLGRVPPAPRETYDLIVLSPEGAGWMPLPSLVGHEDVEGLVLTLREGASLAVRVEDAEGKPLPAAPVRLQPRLEPLVHGVRSLVSHDLYVARPEQAGRLLRRATDADGRARFANLPTDDRGTARYDVVAIAEGYAPGWTDKVALRKGETTDVVVVLHPKKKRRILGRVLTIEGVPVTGAEVQVFEQPATRTDAEGYYTIQTLDEEWDWVGLRVEAEGYAPLWRRVTLARGGEDTEADFELSRATPIAGRVIDQHGVPVEAVTLQLVRRGSQGAQTALRTDAEGRFRFPHATAGTWNVQVNPPSPYDAWERRERMRVLVGGDEAAEIVLQRVEAGRCTLVGRVIDDATEEALDPSEARVLWAGDGDPPSVPMATIDVRVVTCARVKPGRWYLWVSVPDRGVAFEVFEVRENDERVETVVRVRAPGRIVGRLDFGDLPVETSGRVFVFAEVAESRRLRGRMSRGGQRGGFAFSKDDGTFELEGLMPTRHRVRVVHTGFLGEAVVVVPAGGAASVVVAIRRGGVLAFRTEKEVAKGVVVEFFVAEGDADYRQPHRLGDVKASVRNHEATVEPGRTRWRVRFDPDNVGGQRHWAEPVEGEVVVSPGERVEIVVPVQVRQAPRTAVVRRE